MVNTFAEGYDWEGKKIVLFATSGGSGMGKSAEKLSPYLKGKGEIIGVKLIRGDNDIEELVKGK